MDRLERISDLLPAGPTSRTVRKKQDITIENNELEIQGGVEPYNPEKKELKYSEFTQYDYYRKFYVGNDINRDKINATLENGVLPLVL